MAIKARETITIIKERDVNAIWRFYRIASSSSTPTQPTEAQGKAYVNNQTIPSGWSISEPAYDGTSTNSLYTCDLTSFTDGEVSWSTVSKSSSYEAAKQAYNEAQNAKKVATNYLTETSADGLMVHRSTDSTSGWKIASALELLVSGVSHIWAGIENAVAMVRVGLSTAGNIVLSGNGYVDVRHGSTVMAHFGYDSGASTSGTATAPYYTLGTRKSGTTIGNWSLAEGLETQASGAYSHAEGHGAKAVGYNSHAEGYQTYAGINSHAEGYQTTASYYTYANHAEGYETEATGGYCHAAGWGTIASKMGQTVIGEFNIEDTGSITRNAHSHGQYAFIIGNGIYNGDRSNAMAVGWDGTVDCSGGYKINGKPLITTATMSADNKTIAKQSTDSFTFSIAKTGYTPIAIRGFDIDNASSSGANVGSCVVLAAKIKDASTAEFQIRNNATSAAKLKLWLYVTYIATAA